MHKHTAIAIFLLSFLFESTTILAKVTIEINRAANVIAPKADLYIHFILDIVIPKCTSNCNSKYHHIIEEESVE